MIGVVTGGARGLGEAIATRLVADGADVALVDIDREVTRTAERLAETRPDRTVLAYVGDVSDEAWTRRVVGDLVDRLGGMDVLVNNAGIGGPSTPALDTSSEEFRRVLDVNVVGSFLMARACARAMIGLGRGGAIVNLGSIFGQQGVAGSAAYSSSKGAVALLTHTLALELASYGIRVNTVAPGNMLTQMHLDHLRVRAAAEGTSVDEQVEQVRASIPLGRHGTGDDVAGAVAWLASEDASYVTGQTIGVNGGVLLT